MIEFRNKFTQSDSLLKIAYKQKLVLTHNTNMSSWSSLWTVGAFKSLSGV